MKKQDCFGRCPVDCSLCKWCLGNQQMKALQGGMVLQMFHLPASESSAAERVRSNALDQLPCDVRRRLATPCMVHLGVTASPGESRFKCTTHTERKMRPILTLLLILFPA